MSTLDPPQPLDYDAITHDEATRTFNSIVNSHLDRWPIGMWDAPTPPPTPVPSSLRAVFAAQTPHARLLGFQADDPRCFYLQGSVDTPETQSWFTAPLEIPDAAAPAGSANTIGTGQPEGGVCHFFGWADFTVATVAITLIDGPDLLAAVAGGMWWCAPLLDPAAHSTVRRSTWRALDVNGLEVASGTIVATG